MIRLSLLHLTDYGKTVTDFLTKHEPELRCNCRPEESCLVEISELPDHRIDAVVTMPRPVTEPGDWKSYAVVPGMYARRFDRGTPPRQIHKAVSVLVGTKMRHARPPTLSTGFTMVVVDSVLLRKAERVVAGCESCSPLAQVPFDCVLDRISGHDPLVTRYIIPRGTARCPRCRRRIDENTLLAFDPQPET